MLLWTVAVLAFAFAPAAHAENRIALVIGNSDYLKAPLSNPRNDARAISASLTQVGFSVRTLVDADQKAMRHAMLAFGRELRASDSVGLFYFAGHGVQVDGQNYLIPVGADIADASEVPLQGVSLNELLKTMENAESRLNIAILDACRDNPYPARSRSVVRGLAPVQSPAGTLIAFATGPGAVALDGDGTNSPYSGALAANILEVGIPLEETFRRTRRQVLQQTGNRQVPWEHSSLTGEFFFRPKMAPPEAIARPLQGVDARHLAELAAWEKIKSVNDRALLEKHVAAFPDGMFTELAMLRLEKLAKPSSPWTSVVTGSTVTASTRSDQMNAYEEGLKAESRAADSAGFAEAAKLYLKAAETGLTPAMFRLGRLYELGSGVTKNATTAATWYRQAADRGYAPAISALGTLHEFGNGVGEDMAEALRLYRKAADAGDAAGMASLGYLYTQGKGVSRDPKAGRHWYKLAAERGDTRAMFNLALMLVRGQGGPADLAQAVHLLQSAGERGHAGAHRELAYFYDEGRGVARSPDRAAENILAALAGGNKDAERELLTSPGAWSYATRRAIQRSLARRGLYRGATHGIFNRSTKIALQKVASGT
ncbi:MAG: SEL1-like repeat protein [Hyphomicrobiaceae bacterium]|nr:SEL1-like repeat protein [Hyphomicrobiaceae bacterium]